MHHRVPRHQGDRGVGLATEMASSSTSCTRRRTRTSEVPLALLEPRGEGARRPERGRGRAPLRPAGRRDAGRGRVSCRSASTCSRSGTCRATGATTSSSPTSACSRSRCWGWCSRQPPLLLRLLGDHGLDELSAHRALLPGSRQPVLHRWATWACKKAFMTTRIGDVCLLFGMMMIFYFEVRRDLRSSPSCGRLAADRMGRLVVARTAASSRPG